MGQDFMHALGFDDGPCTLCYARRPTRHCAPCVAGDDGVIMPVHIAAIIKMNAGGNDGPDKC
jgi:hypothetical protein